eukprot:scaffold51241_cov64-Phaeocystis_antarctica.AAC.3
MDREREVRSSSTCGRRLPPPQVVGHVRLLLGLGEEAAVLLRRAADDGRVLVLDDDLGAVLRPLPRLVDVLHWVDDAHARAAARVLLVSIGHGHVGSEDSVVRVDGGAVRVEEQLGRAAHHRARLEAGPLHGAPLGQPLQQLLPPSGGPELVALPLGHVVQRAELGVERAGPDHRRHACVERRLREWARQRPAAACCCCSCD